MSVPDSRQRAPRSRPTAWAVCALVFAIVGILLLSFLGPFIAAIELLAVYCGHTARSLSRRKGQRGSRMALAALIVGYLGLLLAPLYIVFIMMALSHLS